MCLLCVSEIVFDLRLYKVAAIFKVLSTGVGLSYQDLGRIGWGRFGVPTGGAMDSESLMRANALLGNRLNAPVLEIALQGVRLELLRDAWVAVAGADLGCGFAANSAQCLRQGMVLEFPRAKSGLWAYVSVPGGFDVESVLGSVSCDVRNGIGGHLMHGDILNSVDVLLGDVNAGVVRRFWDPSLCPDYSKALELEVFAGPQFEQFSLASRQEFTDCVWRVSRLIDRTGYRLEGGTLEVPDSIASEGVFPGCIQVPGSGQPIVTLNDGPTVGGYAKIAVLQKGDLSRFVQAAPGTEIRFKWRKYS